MKVFALRHPIFGIYTGYVVDHDPAHSSFWKTTACLGFPGWASREDARDEARKVRDHGADMRRLKPNHMDGEAILACADLLDQCEVIEIEPESCAYPPDREHAGRYYINQGHPAYDAQPPRLEWNPNRVVAGVGKSTAAPEIT